jgi:hypothetical protein
LWWYLYSSSFVLRGQRRAPRVRCPSDIATHSMS